MISKKITYVDYDGQERTEEFHFHLSESELIKMDFGTRGGMRRMVEKMTQAIDTQQIMATFERFIIDSYGEKSLDGRQFVKKGPDGRPLYEAFMTTPAYDQLFMELLSDTNSMAAFLRGVVPAKHAAEFDKEMASNPDVVKLMN